VYICSRFSLSVLRSYVLGRADPSVQGVLPNKCRKVFRKLTENSLESSRLIGAIAPEVTDSKEEWWRRDRERERYKWPLPQYFKSTVRN
jgi:hypothetical protein